MEGSRSPRQPPQHQADHGHLDERLAALHLPLVVLAQTAVTYQPRKSSLHYPPLRQNIEAKQSIMTRDVVKVLVPLFELRGEPAYIRSNNGPCKSLQRRW